MTNAALGMLFNALAYAVGWTAYSAETRRLGINTLGVFWIMAWGIFGGVMAAKFAETLIQGAPLITAITPEAGGRTIIAGILGGWLCVEVVKRRMGIRCSTGNAWALALSSGEAVGRIGCWFGGCCFGRTWSGPLSVWTHDAWRYPTQFMQSAFALVTFGILFSLRKRVALFPVYLVLWSFGRFGIEFLRQPISASVGLTVAQWVSVALGISSTIWLIRVASRGPVQPIETCSASPLPGER